MQKEQHDPLRPREQSDVWQELLGYPGEQAGSVRPAEGDIPALESDPWNELLHAQGTEVVDLHAIRLRMSDRDVEQVLQVMQEESPAHPHRSCDQTTDK